MKKVLFVDSYVEKGEAGKNAQLRRVRTYQELMPDLDIYFGVLSQMIFLVKDNKLSVYDLMNDCEVSEYDAVIIEYWALKPMQALAFTTYLTQAGIPFSPSEPYTQPAVDKLGEFAKMSGGEVPLPNSLMAQGGLLVKSMKKFGQFIGYPCVVKAAQAGRGKNNYLAKSPEELKALSKKFGHEVVVVQSFIANDSDYRVIVYKGEPRFVMRRFRDPNSDTHLNNVSMGAGAEEMGVESLTPEAKDAVLTAARLTGRSGYAGVDLMYELGTNKPYILEVNKKPDIVTGATKELIDTKLQLFEERVRDLLK